MERYSQICLYIALASTFFYLVKMAIFLFIGGDTEVDCDFTTETETETSFSFLSIQSILAFFMGFGWLGLACLTQLKLSLIVTILLSVIFGLLMMFLSAYLMFSIKKLNHVVKKDKNDCIGKTAKTYTKFNPHAKGQIQIEINHQINTVDAFNDTDEEIPSFVEVKVVKFENNVLYIEKV